MLRLRVLGQLRPPVEQAGVFDSKHAANVDEADRRAAFRKAPALQGVVRFCGLALPRMHVDFAARDVDVAAQDELAALFMQALRPRCELAHELELRRMGNPPLGT